MGILKTTVDLTLRAGIWVFNKAIAPYEGLRNNETLTRDNILSFLEKKSVSEYLNYASCATDKDNNSVYLLKDGRYGIVLEVQLPSFASSAVEEQIRSLLKGMDESVDVVTFNTFASQNLEKQYDRFLDTHPCQANIKHRGLLKSIIKRRYEYLKRSTRESMYEKIDFRLRNYVSTLSIIFNEEVSEEDCFLKIESIKGSMGSYPVRSVPPELFVALQREFFFHDRDASFWNDSTDQITSLDRQIVRGGLKVNVADERHPRGFVINDETFVTVMTTKKFPHSIDFDDTDAIFMDRLGMNAQPHITGPFFTSLVLDYRDAKKVREEALAKAQRNFNETSKHRKADQKKRPDLKKRYVESVQNIEIIDSGRDRPVPGQWTLVLWENDQKKLLKSISAIQNSFSLKGWEIIPETFGHIAFFSAIHALPLQLNIVIDELLKRKPILFESSNHCPIVPWLGETNGFTSDPAVPQFSRTGQQQWFNPFDSGTGYNIACSGTTGSGKSYNINEILVMMLAKGAVVRIIDSLASYKKVAHALGGQYEEFTGTDFCMNFFTNIMHKVDEVTGVEELYVGNDGVTYSHISDEDYATIIPMVGLMIGAVLTSTKSETVTTTEGMKEAYLTAVLEQAIRLSYEARGREAGMKEVYQFVQKKYQEEKTKGNDEQASLLNQASRSLERFGLETGSYFRNFNGVNNIDINSDYSVFELQALKEKGILYPLTVMSIANRISTEFFNMDDRTRPKILAIDEFWLYLDMPVMLNFTNELARKVRKARGSLMPISQGIDDFFYNDKMKAIYDNCAWQFILKNKPVSIDNAIMSKKLSVSSYASTLLKNINPREGEYGEFAILNGSSIQFSRLRVDGISHFLYSSSDKDEAKIQKTAKHLGIDYQKAIEFLGVQRDEPSWDETRILVEIGILEPEQLEAKKALEEKKGEDIKTSLKKTLELSNFVIEDRLIRNKDNEIVLNILRFAIKSPDHDLFYFDEYARKMIELELDAELTIQMFDKMLLSDNRKYPSGIIVPLSTLMGNRLFAHVKEIWKPGAYSDLSLIIDVSIKDHVEIDGLEAILNSWRELGFDIHVKRYDFSVDNILSLSISPKFTVIDASKYDDRQNLSHNISFARVFSEDVILINSEKISAYFTRQLGINMKDFEYGKEAIEGDDENIAIVERVENVSE
jgi:conjugal transfer ATP-binding protein TraC